MGTVVEEEEQAAAIIAIQQSSPSTNSTTAAHIHGSNSSSGGSRSLQVSPPTTTQSTGSSSNNTAADHRDRHHHQQQQQSTSSSNSSFIPRRTRHRVDAGEPRGCFNNFYPSNSHSGAPFRFLYSSQAQAQAQAQHHHHQHQHSSSSGTSPFLLSENSLIGGLPRLYQQPPQHLNHRSTTAAQHHAAAFSAAAAAAALAPHTHTHSHHNPHHAPHSHHQQQLLFYEQQQREQQLKMLGELHHQQLLRDMLQKKAAPGIAATNNNPVNNNNNNTIMGLMSGKGGKSGYEEDCEEIARAREEIEKNVTRHGGGADNVNSNASSGLGSGSADSVVSVTSVNNSTANSGSGGGSSTRINGCKKRKLYQPQRSDIDGKTPSAGAGGPGSNAEVASAHSGGLRSGSDDDEDEMMMDEEYEQEENDMEERESMPVETELGTGDDGDEDEYVKKEDEANSGGTSSGMEQEKVNRHERGIISEHNNNHQQGTKRVLRSQHRQMPQQQQQPHGQQREQMHSNGSKHHNSDHSELLMNEISERKEKYGGLMMPQFKRASPNFLQQQQLAPITRHLLQAENNNSNSSRSSPLKQSHGIGVPAPIAQQQFQQLIQFRDSLKSTLIPHLNDFIDGQFSLFLQQQQQLFQAQLALQEQQRQAQDHARRERPPSSNSHHESGLMHQQQQNVLLNGGGATNGPRSLLVKSPGFPGSGFNHLKSSQQQAQQQTPQQPPHHQNLFTSALSGLYQHSRNNGLYLDEMDTDSPLSLVVTPKKKRHKVTDTRLTPRAVHRLLESGGGLHHRGGGVIGVDVDRPTYIPEEMSSPPPPSTVLPPHQLPSVLPSGGGAGTGLPNGGSVNSLMDRTNSSQLFSPSAAAAVAMYNAAILNGIQAQAQQQQRSAESPIPNTLLPTAVRDRSGVDRDREDRKRANNNNGSNNANLEDYVQQLRELNNNSAGSADSQDTVGSYDLRECGSSYGGQSITSTAPIGGTSSTLTPMHLRKAKLMFFWVRYPSSAVLKMYFPDIRFNKNNTAQLVKWFSNFREFYYIQMEKYSRQAIAEGIKTPEEIIVTTDHELYRVLNLHYNRNNHIEVPANFRFVVEQTLREFFKSVQVGKDSEQSWKKAIYKIIARMDDPVPEYFKSSNFLEQLE